MEIGDIIAYNLKRLRRERNLSLGQLAEIAGVSKVILSQIEKGDSNPTINTIWKITGALGLPYTSLLEMPGTKAVHIKKSDITELAEGKFHIFSYYPKNQERNFEIYQIEVEPGCVHSSIGHSPNSFEYIMMIEGEMTLIVNGESFLLRKDDALYFDASVSHCYRNDSEITAKAMMLVQYI